MWQLNSITAGNVGLLEGVWLSSLNIIYSGFWAALAVAHLRPFERHQLQLWSVCKPGYVLWQQLERNAQGVMGWICMEQGDCKEHAVA